MPRWNAVLENEVDPYRLPLAQHRPSTPVAVKVMWSLVRYRPAMKDGRAGGVSCLSSRGGAPVGGPGGAYMRTGGTTSTKARLRGAVEVAEAGGAVSGPVGRRIWRSGC